MSGGDNLDFEIRPHPAPVAPAQRTAMLANPGFGQIFTDHMVTIRYADGKGWYDPRVEARAPIPMDPASAVLHYAQEIFEGLKAYTTPDGGVAMFRPDANAARFAASAQRMAMPAVPTGMFLESLRQIIRIDRQWLPQIEDGSLYLRPFAFASEVFLGVRPAREYLYLVIASPAGAYFSGGLKPVTLWVSPDYTRAAPGGTGAAKCGGNYAAGLAAQAEAIEHGCDQVVYLDAVERTYIDELGGMNVFFVLDDGTLVTPPLTGTILPGITRESVIKLAEKAGRRVEERKVSFEEWRTGAASGRIREAFACGTAAVITPIGTVRFPDGEFTVADGDTGPVTGALRQELVDIQRGRAADPFGWVHRVI
ncbi:branched-chain amino acid aminotransferase [Krasilnikovia cinnamomea]|uniref:Branched-chain-amino-acid aminotransferase n=1 Tax=Krasilnikovia cinnamomea TaxID=349313 RepID=A0A4Q7ZGE5_9ACTN|nr:branched-chain amino acid aminotransferase [Krasilnikovia cinnamomea]RZU49837.1 branched-chain amino acid aminotransferase [Krasilnikovia cinnamomea]